MYDDDHCNKKKSAFPLLLIAPLLVDHDLMACFVGIQWFIAEAAIFTTSAHTLHQPWVSQGTLELISATLTLYKVWRAYGCGLSFVDTFVQ